MYAFSEYLGYDKNMIQKLHRFCLFTSLFYVKVWLTSSNAIDAPINNLQFWKNMQMFKKIDPGVAEAALIAQTRHLWYLSEEVAPFALFSGSVSTHEKKKIASTILKKINDENMETGVPVMPQMNQNVKVSSLIGKNTRLLFDLLKVNTKWLSLYPDEWSKNDEFNYISGILKDLKVVNNLAERSVKLVTDFNQSLTRDENQKQCLFQVVD